MKLFDTWAITRLFLLPAVFKLVTFVSKLPFPIRPVYGLYGQRVIALFAGEVPFGV